MVVGCVIFTIVYKQYPITGIDIGLFSSGFLFAFLLIAGLIYASISKIKFVKEKLEEEDPSNWWKNGTRQEDEE